MKCLEILQTYIDEAGHTHTIKSIRLFRRVDKINWKSSAVASKTRSLGVCGKFFEKKGWVAGYVDLTYHCVDWTGERLLAKKKGRKVMQVARISKPYTA